MLVYLAIYQLQLQIKDLSSLLLFQARHADSLAFITITFHQSTMHKKIMKANNRAEESVIKWHILTISLVC